RVSTVMTLRAKTLFTAIVLAATAGCYTGSPVDTNLAGEDPKSSVDATDTPPRVDGGTPKKKPAASTGLPCDVAAILQTSCAGCHGAKLSGGAPNSLVTYDDLAAKSANDASKTIAALSVERM